MPRRRRGRRDSNSDTDSDYETDSPVSDYSDYNSFSSDNSSVAKYARIPKPKEAAFKISASLHHHKLLIYGTFVSYCIGDIKISYYLEPSGEGMKL